MRALTGLVCALTLSCASPGLGTGPRGLGEEAARAVLERFARALEEGKFDEAYALLSARWRSSYTPGRLALDWAGAGPVASEASRRALKGLVGADPLVQEGDGRARLVLEGGRAAVLVPEAGAWRVEALE